VDSKQSPVAFCVDYAVELVAALAAVCHPELLLIRAKEQQRTAVADH
jgi:hypothetical protein